VARRITCINKHDGEDALERITHVGGEGWKLSEQEAIRRINTGRESFYVEEPSGDPTVVVVGIGACGTLYLRTTTDSGPPNDLLSLPECR
jgi:hypothetical protein